MALFYLFFDTYEVSILYKFFFFAEKMLIIIYFLQLDASYWQFCLPVNFWHCAGTSAWAKSCFIVFYWSFIWQFTAFIYESRINPGGCQRRCICVDIGVGFRRFSGNYYEQFSSRALDLIVYNFKQNWAEQSCPMVSLVPVILFIIWQCVMTPGMTSLPAHISGAITGLLFGFLVLKNIKEHPFERKITKVAVVLGVVYLGTLILLNICNVYT